MAIVFRHMKSGNAINAWNNMNKTLLDAVKENRELSGKEGYLQIAKEAPKIKDNSFWNTVKDYGKTALKGAIEGVTRLGESISPNPEMPRVENGKLILPKSRQLGQEEQSESLNELLPTEEGYGQKALRRGLQQAPSMMAFPGAGVQAGTRSLLAGAAGQGAEELGAPEWAQTLAEIGAFIGPDVTKKLMASGKNKELITAGRKLGMTDEQLTPLVQSEFKQKLLTKFAPRRGATEKALSESKKGLSNAFNSIRDSEAAVAKITPENQDKLFKHFTKILEDMPASVRNKIYEDAKDLVAKPVTGRSLINFYQDINSAIGHDSKQLSLLKAPIKEALKGISPELGKDFESLNTLYSKYFPIASRLKPTLTTDLISALEVTGILGSFVTGNPSFLTKFLSERAGRKVAQQMLINPRLQQLGSKMVDAMNSNKFGVVKKLSDLIANEFKESSPETYETLKEISEEDIKKMFKGHQKQ